MKTKFVTLAILLIGIYSHCNSQDYRDKFVGNYLCDIQTISGTSNTWDTGTIIITKSDTNSTQIIISRSQSQYSIATVDTVGHFVVSSNPYGEWGDFYISNDSLYYFRNGGSAMGLYFYYFGKKTQTSVYEIFQDDNTIKIYPNPTKDKLYLSSNDFDNNSFVKIYDLKGQLISTNSTKSIGNFLEIDVSNLKSGFYFINLLTNKKSFNSKFLKQ